LLNDSDFGEVAKMTPAAPKTVVWRRFLRVRVLLIGLLVWDWILTVGFAAGVSARPANIATGLLTNYI
jgi:hypothetical protein